MKSAFRLVAVCAVLGAALGAFAVDIATWTGAGDLSNPFGDAANWKNQRPPQAGWQIQFNAGAPALHIGDTDAAFASALDSIYLVGSCTVYWETTTNCCLGARITGGGGMFYKMGKDTVLYFNAPYNNAFDYGGQYTVAEGKVCLPDYAAARHTGAKPPATTSSFNAGFCTVSNGATLVLAQAHGKDTTTTFYRLLNFGSVTNECDSVHDMVTFGDSSTDENPSRIVGDLGGNLRLGGYYHCDIENTACTYTEFYPMGAGSSSFAATVGLMKFGLKGEDYSSMGYKANSLRYAWDGVLFRYLGVGETTDKDFSFALHKDHVGWAYNHPAGLDGGPHGGLVFTGKIATDAAYNQVLRFTGENPTPCTYAGLFTIKSAGVTNYAPHILKDGPGIWRFNETAGRSSGNAIGLSGAMSVEDGTLQFDTLGEVGENCALGTANDLYDKYIGVYDASKKVAWAYSLGSTNGLGVAEKEGTLECVGTETAFASRRPISLLGHGRLKNSGEKSLHLRGVTSRLAGEHTFTLDGANALTNVISEVADGVAGAKLSVVKEGTGLWSLKGPSSFSGDLAVKAGTLIVDANTNRFSWFRFTERRNGGAPYMSLGELEFYDKDGKCQNLGLKLPTGWSGNSTPIRHECMDMPPGTIFYGKAGTVAFYSSGLTLMVDGRVKTNAGGDYTGSAYTTSGNVTEANSCNWIPLVLHLADGKNQVVSYDLCQGTNAPNIIVRYPYAYLIEGSQDGADWQVLKDVSYDPDWQLPGEYRWYSDGTEFSADHYPTNENFRIDGAPAPFTALANVRSVSVAPGATLKTADPNVAPIAALSIGTSGAGTIDGFAFAEGGTVDIVAGGKLEPGLLPITVVNSPSADSLKTWKVTVNGSVDPHYDFTVTPEGVTVFKKGLVIIFR